MCGWKKKIKIIIKYKNKIKLSITWGGCRSTRRVGNWLVRWVPTILRGSGNKVTLSGEKNMTDAGRTGEKRGEEKGRPAYLGKKPDWWSQRVPGRNVCFSWTVPSYRGSWSFAFSSSAATAETGRLERGKEIHRNPVDLPTNGPRRLTSFFTRLLFPFSSRSRYFM